MTTTELMLQLSNPETIKTLSFTSKLSASLITTALGMGITFSALILLQFLITWMKRIFRAERQAAQVPATSAAKEAETAPEEDEDELAAVITAVLAEHLKTSSDNIVIKNITRVEDPTPAWSRAGILEQINSRLY